jgi:hypothetical protein
MDENDLKGVSEAMNELRETGTLSSEALAKLGGNTSVAYKALEGYTKAILGAGSAVGGMAKTVAQGEGTFSSLGSTIVGLTSVVGKLAGALPLVGGAAKALAEGVGEASKFILDQLDVMAKNYQTLGDASAGAADGVDGLLRQFNQMGNYSLPAFTKAVKANTVGLSALSGTAADGAESLSKVSGALTTGQTAQRFLKLGMSLDAVGDATASYLANSARYGLTQGNTTEELTKKTQNYIEEVDKIARLTGQTREAQQKEAQKSLVDARFRAKLADMAANGQTEQAEELRKYVEGLGGAAGDAARALATGIPLTKEAAQANLFTNDALRQNTMAIQDGKKATVAIAETQQAMADGTVRFGKQIMYAGDMAGGMAVQAYDQAAIIKEQNKLMATGLTREQAIEAIQKKQMTASGKNTEEFTSAQLATAGASKDLQSLGFTLAKTAIPAVDAFATSLKSVTGFIDEKFGSGKAGGAGGKTVGSGMVDRVKSLFGFGSGAAPTGGSKEALLNLIGQGESKGNYNALVYGKKGANTPGSADLTNMTIAQVQEYQKGMMAKGHASTAVGKYQMISSTLAEQVKKAGLDAKTTKFDQKTQDLLASQLIDQAGFGKKDSAAVMKNLAGTWASLPKDMSGRGAYDGFNQNKATINAGDVQAAISGPSKTDSQPVVVAGPRSGYKPQEVGGTPNRAGLETTAQANQASNQQQTESANDRMIQRLDELVALQRQNNSLNAKILQQAKS